MLLRFLVCCLGVMQVFALNDSEAMRRVGKVRCGNPMVTTTSFNATQLFSLSNIHNKTKDIVRSGAYTLNSSGEYSPASTAVGSPMLKIKSSTVEIDLNGMEISYTGTAGDGYVGIEVGFAPSESGTQPTDVVIKNGTIKGFDLGILVHSGVKNVMLDNVQIIDSSVGVLLMGQTGSYHNSSVVSCVLSGVSVIGHGADRRAALVNLKTLIETTYQYNGGNEFMPLRADPLNADTVDVYTYMGIVAIYSRNLLILNSNVQGVGYDGYDEGNTNRTEGVGIVIRDCARVGIKDSYVERSASETKAVGLQIEDTNDVEIESCQFNSNVSSTKAVGCEFFTQGSPDYIVESMKMNNCECNLNYSDDTAMGADFSQVRNLEIFNSVFNRNNGKKTCYGIYSGKIHYGVIQDTACNTNFADNVSVQTAEGVIAAGIYLKDSDGGTNDILSVHIKNVDANSNIGTNTGRGIYVNGASALTIENVTCSLNEGTSLRTTEDTDLIGTTTNVAGHDQSTTVISSHLGVLTQTGGVGLWLENVDNCFCSKVSAMTNKGVRATGILGKSCSDCSFISCETTSQQSTGSCFHTDLGSQTATALGVDAAHQQLLFGGDSLTSIQTVFATDQFLLKANEIKVDQLDKDASEDYDDLRTVISAMNLLQGGVARFRLWGTAVGMHLHNSSGCFIDNHKSMRNSAPKDSAMGIAFTGESQACIVRNSELSHNIGWTDSQRTSSTQAYSHTFELNELYPFWNMIAGPKETADTDPDGTAGDDLEWRYASDTTETGFYINSSFTAQGVSLKIQLANATGVHQLVNPVGPATIGCLIGDAALDFLIEDNVIQGNNGHSGQAYGILMDTAFSAIIRSNRVYNTTCNAYGMGWGIAEFTAHSASVQIKNEASGNRCGTYYNANYMIPFDPNDLQLGSSMALQSVSSHNGDLTDADALNDVENFEIKYINSTQNNYFHEIQSTFDAILHTDLVARWDEDANDWTA